MSQIPPGRDFFVWAVMAEAKVDNFGRTPASRTRSKNGSSCVGGWVPRDLTLPAHETGKGRPHPGQLENDPAPLPWNGRNMTD